jgi:hypothetical protein
VATARELILRAFRRARILGVDQTPSAEEENEALDTLNQLLDSWWTERLSVYQIVQENFSLTSGTSSRTIGSGGNFDTTRPVRITGAFVRDSSTDYPLRVAEDRSEYNRIVDKTAQGTPGLLFYDTAYPLGTVYVWPVPDRTYTLYIDSHKRLESFTNAADAVDLPPGYDRLIVNGLAIEVAPDFGVTAPTGVVAAFSSVKQALKRLNAPAPVMGMPASIVGGGGRYDIVTDT